MDVGIIKTIKLEIDQLSASIITGSGMEVTAVVMQAGHMDFHPQPGDRVIFEDLGQEVVVIAIISADASTGLGETLIFSRSVDGSVVASILLGADGNITLSPATTVDVGLGSDFVAMAAKVDALWTALNTACATFVPPGAPDGGAALSAAISGAILGVGIGAGATNLKAD